MTILDKIVAKKKDELSSLTIPESRIVDTPFRSLKNALLTSIHPLGIIAEIKQASPSKGLLTDHFQPLSIAAAYEKIGVSGISVLTDETFFKGHADDLSAVKNHVNLPVLRKDFIVDEKQVLYSERIGADAILLIAAILEGNQLAELYDQAMELGMEILVEVHNEEELEKVLTHTNPTMIGVNNRDLTTFDTHLSTTERLRPLVTNDETLFISESGIHTKEDVECLLKNQVDGMLVGEAFMRSANKQQLLNSLFYEGEK
ncbi:indole-3-glycerol phosphate synthase TrpC [Salipaludibacillus agaradhaerens]|uniref:indole-3-glycerol phosphate synthase TrpC n=1 Tax=Salipaludibacillus agaradhaerens TaxID=76935 RepID=UPI000998A131|nr:indole-3-glycerol phosphate synthase TrpC [Salipaludibacillus agaradhaerens]